MTARTDPFAGWTMWSVGCHWSRTLPDGREATLSSGGPLCYRLTVDFEGTDHPDLASALAQYDRLADQ